MSSILLTGIILGNVVPFNGSGYDDNVLSYPITGAISLVSLTSPQLLLMEMHNRRVGIFGEVLLKISVPLRMI